MIRSVFSCPKRWFFVASFAICVSAFSTDVAAQSARVAVGPDEPTNVLPAGVARTPQLMERVKKGEVALLKSKPRIPYPREARLKGMVGLGSYVVSVNPQTGRVTSIKIEKSTGYKLLDDGVVATLKQARFWPGARTVRIPVTFSMPNKPFHTPDGIFTSPEDYTRKTSRK